MLFYQIIPINNTLASNSKESASQLVKYMYITYKADQLVHCELEGKTEH